MARFVAVTANFEKPNNYQDNCAQVEINNKKIQLPHGTLNKHFELPCKIYAYSNSKVVIVNPNKDSNIVAASKTLAPKEHLKLNNQVWTQVK